MKNNEHGGNIYKYTNCLDFSTNLNPLGPPECVRQAILQSMEQLAAYPQTGYAPLCKAVAAYEQIAPEAVICGNGAAELIYTLCQTVRPKKALLAVPTFSEYARALESVGCEVSSFFLKREEGYRLTTDFYNVIEEHSGCMMFLCNPNNPTGLLIEPALLQRILKLCEKHRILLVVDECFLDFVSEPEKHTLKPHLDTYRNLFILKSLTKRYAIPALRIGYGLCKNEKLLKDMHKQVQPWNISGIAAKAGIAALRDREIVSEGRRIVFQEREYLMESLERIGYKVYPSETNYLFFEGPEDLFENCIRHGFLIRDCSNYEGLGEGSYRIAVRTREENQQLIDCLRSVNGESLWQKQL